MPSGSKETSGIYGLFVNAYGSEDDKELFVVHCIITITGMVLNVAVIFLVICSRRLHEVEGIAFVFNLSCANFIFSSLILFSSFTTKYEHTISKSACNAIAATTTFSCIAASLSRCVVALDRYIYISDPLHYFIRSSDTKIALLITCLWLASGCISLTPYITNIRDDTDARCLPKPAPVYAFCVLFLGVVCPMIYEVFVYTRIFYWALLHIQIMKQEAAVYGASKELRPVKESFYVNLQQFEMYTRASYLMISEGLEPSKYQESTVVLNDNPAEKHSSNNWVETIRRFTMTSIGPTLSIFSKFADQKQTRSSGDSCSISSTNESSLGSIPISYKSTSVDSSQVKPVVQISVSTATQQPKPIKSLEDAWLESELARLSLTVISKNNNLPSKTAYPAILQFLTFTELRAAFILFVILSTSVGFWIPFLITKILDFVHGGEESLFIYMQISLTLLYLVSTLDPIAYDFLHQPFRTALIQIFKRSRSLREATLLFHRYSGNNFS